MNKSLLSSPKRIQSMMLALQRYALSVKWKPGKEQVTADWLSRQTRNCQPTMEPTAREHVFQLQQHETQCKYSEYFEFEKLSEMTAASVIYVSKKSFARLGSPLIVYSDNGPQFTAREFARFSEEWDFEHTTSSPYHSQSTGKAESSVKQAKRLLKRAKDVQLALLEHRNTTTAGMTTSPIQRLLHRSTRSILPQLRLAEPVNHKHNRDEKEKKRQKTEKRYNHRAKDLPPLKEGQSVLLRDYIQHKRAWKDAHVHKQLTDRSYSVLVDGDLLRRNRRHFIPQATVQPASVEEPPIDQTEQNEPDERPDERPDQPAPPAVTTRSGRLVKPPSWLRDYV